MLKKAFLAIGGSLNLQKRMTIMIGIAEKLASLFNYCMVTLCRGYKKRKKIKIGHEFHKIDPHLNVENMLKKPALLHQIHGIPPLVGSRFQTLRGPTPPWS